MTQSFIILVKIIDYVKKMGGKLIRRTPKIDCGAGAGNHGRGFLPES